jgi:peptidyl-prolyl cis-trans isomerase C
MAVVFNPPPSQPNAPAAHAHPAQPALPEHDIVVNGTVISAAEIAAEMQHHPSPDAMAAWESAARALVVRRLLLDAAAPEAGADEEAAVDALLAREIRVPEPDDAAGARWLAAHPERFGTAEAWEASHILLAADPEEPEERAAATRRAEELLGLLRAVPGRLPELAREHSACPSREQGGMLGRVERGSTVAPFEAALAGLTPGAFCAEPVATRYGIHVVQLHRHIPARLPPYDEVRPRVLRDLRAAAWEAALRHTIAVLAAQARIEGFILGAEGEARADGPLVN